MKIVHDMSKGSVQSLGEIPVGSIFSLDGIPNSLLIKVGSDNSSTVPILKFDYAGLKWDPDRFEADEPVTVRPMTFES